MNLPEPHFLLLADAIRRNERDEWSFVLHAADGSAIQTVNEVEPHQHGERLELLSVVRGLEALDQPSRVTLVTRSKYVRRGIAFGLEEWRNNDWTWECYGEMVPVKNRDLWQRLDRAMSFHQIELRTSRVDGAHSESIAPASKQASGGHKIPAPHFLRREQKRTTDLEPAAAATMAPAKKVFDQYELVEVDRAGQSRSRTLERSRTWLAAAVARWKSELVSWLLVKARELGVWLGVGPWLDEGAWSTRWSEQKLSP